jgi:N-acetyl-gamma-glutamyl-phosphate reductase
VRGSNHCLIGLFEDRVAGRAILVSVIDNLVKGAASQPVISRRLPRRGHRARPVNAVAC